MMGKQIAEWNPKGLYVVSSMFRGNLGKYFAGTDGILSQIQENDWSKQLTPKMILEIVGKKNSETGRVFKVLEIGQNFQKKYFNFEEFLKETWENELPNVIVAAVGLENKLSCGVFETFSYFPERIRVMISRYSLSSIVFAKRSGLYWVVSISGAFIEVQKAFTLEKHLNWGDAICSCIEAGYFPELFVYEIDTSVCPGKSKGLLSRNNKNFLKSFMETMKNPCEIPAKRVYLTEKLISELILQHKNLQTEELKEIDNQHLIALCELHLPIGKTNFHSKFPAKGLYFYEKPEEQKKPLEKIDSELVNIKKSDQTSLVPTDFHEISPKSAENEPKIAEISPKHSEISPKPAEISPKPAEIIEKFAEVSPFLIENFEEEKEIINEESIILQYNEGPAGFNENPIPNQEKVERKASLSEEKKRKSLKKAKF